MLQFILGRAGSGKTAEVFSRVAAALKDGKSPVLLVPEQFSFETERAAALRFGMKDAARVQILSFTRLAERVLRQVGGVAEQVMSDVTRTLLLSRALEIHTAPENAPDAARQPNDTAYLQAAGAFFAECRQCGVSPRLLSLAAKDLEKGKLRERLSDLAALFDIYDGLLAVGGIDAAGRLQMAADRLPSVDIYDGAPIFADGFKGFTAPELAILSCLMQSSALTVTLCTDPDGNAPLFAPVDDVMRDLRTLAEEAGVTVLPPVVLAENRRSLTPALQALERGAFAPTPTVFDGDAKEVTVTPCPDIFTECTVCARTVRRLMRAEGLRARDIAVVVRDLPAYDGILDAAMRRAGVPFYMDTAADIYTLPLPTLMTAALHIAAAGFSTEILLRMLKTGILPFDETETALLENYTYTWRIDGARWEKPFTADPNGLSEKRRFDRAGLEKLEALRVRLIAPLADLRAALRDRTDGKTFAGALYAYLVAVDAAEGVRRLFAALSADGAPAAADMTARIWDEMMGLLDEFAVIFGAEHLPCRRYEALFHLAVGLLRVPALPQSPDAVQIGSADHVRLSSPAAVLILGANEGVFPAAPAESPLLGDRDRETLAKSGVRLSGDRLQKVKEERLFAYLTLAAPRRFLFASYLTSGAPSAIIDTIDTILPHHAVGSIASPDGSDIESPAEGFDRLAAVWREETPLRATLAAALSDRADYAAFADGLRRVTEKAPAALSPARATALFGSDLRLSASQADAFYHCSFKYFCQYGLHLKTRRIADVDASLFGTLTHYLLETLLPRYAASGAAPDLAALRGTVHNTLFAYIEREMGGLADKPARFAYLLSLIERTCVSLLWFSAAELAQSRFSPVAYELQLGTEKLPAPTLPLANGGSITLVGKIDRVDVYRRGDTEFLRVIDYKTGTKEFRLSDIPYGLNMQLLLYLFALCSHAVPAGALYLPAKDITLKNGSAPPDESRLKMLRMNGPVLADADVIDAMDAGGRGVFIAAALKDGAVKTGKNMLLRADFAAVRDLCNRLLLQMAGTLQKGDIAAVPTGEEKKLPCSYCDFRAACGREEDGDAVYVVNKRDDAVLTALREEETDGKKMD